MSSEPGAGLEREDEQTLPALPVRPADGHKGTFGTVWVVGGQAAGERIMVGGPAFTALASLRVGAGLAVLAVPNPIMAAALVVAPSATGLSLPVDDYGHVLPSEAARILDEHMRGRGCVAIGPGFGADEPQQQVVIRLAARDDLPLVIDADGLNALAATPAFDQDFHAQAILTPHPGEFRRLADTLGLSVDTSDGASRRAAAESLARRLGCVVVLKGAGTVVTDGQETFVNRTGNAALATAGTGDVLTGIIAGLVSQFAWTGPIVPGRPIPGLTFLECARLGVHLHGLAADRWAETHGTAGMLATDLLDLLPGVVRDYPRG